VLGIRGAVLKYLIVVTLLFSGFFLYVKFANEDGANIYQSSTVQAVITKDENSGNLNQNPVVDLNDKPAENTNSLGGLHTSELVWHPSPLEAFSLHPQNPSKVYLDNFKAGSEGNGEASFLMARALQDCMSAVREEDIGRLMEERNFSKAELVKFENQIDRCSGIQTMFSAEEMLSEYRVLINAAVADGNKFALGWDMAFGEQRNSYSEEQKQQTMRELAKTGDPLAYQTLALYTGENLSMPVERSLAWSYLSCKANPICDPMIFNEHLSRTVLPHQYGAVQEVISQLQKSIEESMWSELGI